jgi:hypothetical protein
MAAFGGGETTGSKGALQRLTAEPGGTALLAFAAVGLLGYAIWRFLQGFADADGRGTEAKGIVLRIGYVVSGIAHVLLAGFAASLAFGWGFGGGSGDSTQDWTRELMSKPYGAWLVGAVGLIVIGVAFGNVVKAWKEKYEKRLMAPQHTLDKVSPICRFGLVARAVVLFIIGGMLVYAAYKNNPDDAVGVEGALEILREQAYGPWLLALVGAGLVAFAIYNFILARYRRINIGAF